MSLDRREFMVVAAGGLGWMALNQDGGDDDLIGGGGGAGNQPIDPDPADWLMVATGATETLAAGEANEYYGIEWETDGAITWEDGATLTLRE